jgi:hypothetical protein
MIIEEYNLKHTQELCNDCVLENHPSPLNLPCNLNKPSSIFVTLYPCVQTPPRHTMIPRSYMVVPIPSNYNPHPRPVLASSDQVNSITIFTNTSTNIDALVDNIAIFYKYLHKYGPISIDPTSEQHDQMAELYAKLSTPSKEKLYMQPVTVPNCDTTIQTPDYYPAIGHSPIQNLFVVLPYDTPRPQRPIFVLTKCKTPAITIFNALSVNIDTLGENIVRNYILLTKQFCTFNKKM